VQKLVRARCSKYSLPCPPPHTLSVFLFTFLPGKNEHEMKPSAGNPSSGARKQRAVRSWSRFASAPPSPSPSVRFASNDSARTVVGVLLLFLASPTLAEPFDSSSVVRRLGTGYNVSGDPRNLYGTNASVMLSTAYADQPYCAISLDGTWTCPTTIDAAHEGGAGEQVVSVRSSDGGRTWSPSGGPVWPVVDKNASSLGITNAYSAVTTTGRRTFVIYNDNLWNVTRQPDGHSLSRTDTLGAFLVRWSDDNGVTWSGENLRVPVRLTAIDRNNTFRGTQQMFWNVDAWKTLPYNITEGYKKGRFSPREHAPPALSCVFAYTKIGNYPYNPPEEVYLLASDNLLTVGDSDPRLARFTLLPEGDHGLSPPGGNPGIGEEPHVVPLLAPRQQQQQQQGEWKGGQGRGAPPSEAEAADLRLRRSLRLPVGVDYYGFYVAYRNDQGYLAESHTADTTGKSGWTEPDYAKFACVRAAPVPPGAAAPCGALK